MVLLGYLKSLVSRSLGWEEDDDEVPALPDREEDDTKIVNSDLRNPNVGDELWNISIVEDFGKITALNDENYLIDGLYSFPMKLCEFKLSAGDVVRYIALDGFGDDPRIVKRILQKGIEQCGNAEDRRGNVRFEGFRKTLVGMVVENVNGVIAVEPQNISINLDIIPSKVQNLISGDWINIDTIVRFEDLTGAKEEIVIIESIDYLRKLSGMGTINKLNTSTGTGVIRDDNSDTSISFNSDNCKIGFVPSINRKVKFDAVESDQNNYKWRALALSVVINHNESERDEIVNGIKIKQNASFGDMNLEDCKNLILYITNMDDKVRIIEKCYFSSKRSENQLKLISRPLINRIVKPNETISLTFQCTAKYAGRTKESFIIQFEDFAVSQSMVLNIYGSSKDDIVNEKRNDNYIYRPTRNKGRDPFQGQPTIKGPASRIAPHFIDVRLTHYKLNDEVFQLISKKDSRSLEQIYPFLSEPLNNYNYCNKFHHLLHIAESDGILTMQSFDLHNVYMTKHDKNLSIEVHGLQESKPSLVVGDIVKIISSLDKSKVYSGIINEIDGKQIFFKLHENFNDQYRGESVSVRFSSSRFSYLLMHNAIEKAVSKLGCKILLPTQLNLMDNVPTFKSDLNWFNPILNSIQKKAVLNFINNKYDHPYVVFGPPGTGKSVTLVEAVLQVFTIQSSSRIIIVTPSNSAAYLLMDKLLEHSFVKPGVMIRLISFTAASTGNVPEHLKPYCAMVNIGSDCGKNKPFTEFRFKDILYDCQKSLIGRHRITISTIGSIGSLMQMSFPAGHFTHLFIDEAGQATEPEMLIPMSLLDKNYGKIMIAGDPKQLGPVILSTNAEKYGLGLSFLERIVSTSVYNQADSPLLTQLLYNYRSIPPVLKMPNRLFYEDKLMPTVDPEGKDSIEDLKILSFILSNEDVSYNISNFPGIVFHGVRGTNLRDSKSPSWYNPEEAHMVFKLTCKLFKVSFTCDDIGIITPYVKQVKCIREQFNNADIYSPKIGSVEEFQGQERKIMILSTVRSMESVLAQDINHQLGFVSLPKRVNVALTRAKLLTIIFGNPHILCLDPLWHSIIKDVKENNGYLGCNLPVILED